METLVRASTDVAEAARPAPRRLFAARAEATILLVEVEPLLSDSIKYTLERDGHRVLVAATRGAGLGAIAVDRPGLVIAELGTSSGEITEFCRKARALSAAPLIVIAPAASDADRAEALLAGADDLLGRPFSVREIAHRVSAQLGADRAAALHGDANDEILRLGPVEMDIGNHEVRVRGE